MTGKDAALLRALALNCIDEQPTAALSLHATEFEFDPLHARRHFADWFIANNPEVDKIFEYVEGMFGIPGVSLIDVPIAEIGTDNFWSFSLKEANLPPAARNETAANLEILCSLQLASKTHLHISNSRFDVDIYYVCITVLGVEFLMKCDHEVEQKFRARPSS
jgi:hypothetical protein